MDTWRACRPEEFCTRLNHLEHAEKPHGLVGRPLKTPRAVAGKVAIVDTPTSPRELQDARYEQAFNVPNIIEHYGLSGEGFMVYNLFHWGHPSHKCSEAGITSCELNSFIGQV